jgi:DNA-binding transcriptional LysR family regulator
LANYARRCPEVALELDLSPRRVDLLAENYDLALRIGDLGDDGVLNARKLAEFRSELFAAPGWWQHQGAPEHPGALLAGGVVAAAAASVGIDGSAACALMLGTPGRPQRPWSLARTAGDGGQEVWQGLPARRLVANAPSLLLALARAGEGVALVPRVMAQPHLDSGTLVPVLPGWATAPSAAWAVFPGRRLMPAKTRVLIDMLAAALAACAGH